MRLQEWVLLKSPVAYDSTDILELNKASALYALKLVGSGYSSVVFNPDTNITQTIGVGSTAFGRVVSYDQNTGVLKYWQDRTASGFNTVGTLNSSPTFGFETHRFTADIGSGGSVNIIGGSATLAIQTSFGSASNPGVSTVINSRTYYLCDNLLLKVSLNQKLKNILETLFTLIIDHRLLDHLAKKEDIKVILQF